MRLKITAGELQGRHIELTGPVTVGRDPGCEVTLADGQVSRRHATFTPRGDGTVVLEDLGSRNGTIVDGRPISSPHKLRPGQTVRIGGTTLVLEVSARATPGTPVPPPPVAVEPPASPPGTPAATRRRPAARTTIVLVVVAVLVLGALISTALGRAGSGDASAAPSTSATSPTSTSTAQPSPSSASVPAGLTDAAHVDLTGCVRSGTFPNTRIRFTVKVVVDAPIATLRLQFSTSPLSSPLPPGVSPIPVTTKELTDLRPGTTTTASFTVTDASLDVANSCFVDVLSAS